MGSVISTVRTSQQSQKQQQQQQQAIHNEKVKRGRRYCRLEERKNKVKTISKSTPGSIPSFCESGIPSGPKKRELAESIVESATRAPLHQTGTASDTVRNAPKAVCGASMNPPMQARNVQGTHGARISKSASGSRSKPKPKPKPKSKQQQQSTSILKSDAEQNSSCLPDALASDGRTKNRNRCRNTKTDKKQVNQISDSTTSACTKGTYRPAICKPELPAVPLESNATQMPSNRKSLPHKSCTQTALQARPHRVFFSSNNCKVTILDEEKKVFVIDLITEETCKLIRDLTEDHLLRTELCGSNVKTWRTLYTYTKMDMPCKEVESLPVITDKLMMDIVHIIGDVFGDHKAARKLRPRSYKEPHLLLYQKDSGTNKPDHTGVEMHYDGCAMTFNLMLSNLADYQGGGTYMRSMRTTIKLQMGQCLVHPGELYHSGVDILSGTRFLIVGFMDGFDPLVMDDSTEAHDCKEFQSNVMIV